MEKYDQEVVQGPAPSLAWPGLRQAAMVALVAPPNHGRGGFTNFRAQLGGFGIIPTGNRPQAAGS